MMTINEFEKRALRGVVFGVDVETFLSRENYVKLEYFAYEVICNGNFETYENVIYWEDERYIAYEEKLLEQEKEACRLRTIEAYQNELAQAYKRIAYLEEWLKNNAE